LRAAMASVLAGPYFGGLEMRDDARDLVFKVRIRCPHAVLIRIPYRGMFDRGGRRRMHRSRRVWRLLEEVVPSW
jgi:hypothetical protein